ncbi:MAG TPA: SpoIIE family protein phosphatase [Spirochaetota bacterium]|nr:SpoIIE family protein phosphatase [Spirochaetota bacterium]
MFTLSLITSFLASLLIIFAAVFGLLKNWRDQVMRYYAFFAVCSFGILFTMFLTYALPTSPHLTMINKITQLSTVMSFSSLLVLSMVFPKREKLFPFTYTILILLPALTVAYIAVFTDWNITRAYFKERTLSREFNFFYRYYALITFIYILSAVMNFIIKYVRTKIAIHRLQMRYVFVGTSIGMSIAAFFSIFMPLVYNFSDLYVVGPSLAAFIGMGSFFYAIISYNMMDITTAIHKTTMYSIISTAIFIPIYSILRLWDSGISFMPSIPVYIVAGAVVVVFIVFSIYVQPYIDKLFRRRQHEFEAILDTFVRDVEKTKDFKSLIQRTVDILYESLFLKHAFFILFNNERRHYELYYLKGDSVEVGALERNSPVIRWFVKNQEVLHMDRVYMDDENFQEIRDQFAEFFIANKIKIILPIYHQRTVLGLLCLGDKDTLAAFKPDEITKLNYFQKESNVHISNSLTYEEAMREQFVNRTIELSSGILSKAIPATLPNMIGIKFGAFYVPKYGEGVDYFDFLRPGGQGVGCVSTDISGVGVNSALYAVVMRSAFQSSILEAPSSYTVLQRLNTVLYKYSEGKGGFITAYYFYYDIKTMRLIYSNAGFPPLDLYRIEKNDFDSLDTEGIPLGYDPKANYGMGRTFLMRGDIGILYSKALVNSKNQRGEVFGLNRLRNIVKENRGVRPSELARIINDRFSSFMGISSPESDVLAIVFKIV